MTESAADNQDTAWGKARKSWEVRSLVFILRTIGVILFIGYLFSTWRTAISWAELKWTRSQPLSEATVVAEKYLAVNRPEKLLQWLAMRPKAERADIMTRMEPLSGRMSSNTFIMYSRWTTAMEQMEKAVFWRQYALYRLRYDALRCGSPDSVKSMQGLLAIFPDRATQKYIDKNPAIVKTSIRQVLDFDARHPAENDPVDVCPTLVRLEGSGFKAVPREKWAAIRHTLRIVTEDFLKK